MSRPTYRQYRNWGQSPWVAFTMSRSPFGFLASSALLGAIIAVALHLIA